MRVRAGAQHHAVAGLQAEAGGVGGHVRAVLVDDAHHPQGDPHLADPEPVGADPPGHDLADRHTGSRNDRLGLHRRSDPQSIEHGWEINSADPGLRIADRPRRQQRLLERLRRADIRLDFMLCCVCKEKPATVHLTEIKGDKVQKVDL